MVIKPVRKPKNVKYVVKSNFKQYLDDFASSMGYKRLSDLYEEMGEYVGLSPISIKQLRMETDKAPSYVTAIKIAEFFGIDSPSEIWEVVDSNFEFERKECIVDDCDRVATTKGLCTKHLYLLKKVNKEGELKHEFVPSKQR